MGTSYDGGHLCRAVCCRAERKNEGVLSGYLPESYNVNHPEVGQGLLENQGTVRETETKIKTAALSLNWAVVDKDYVEVTEGSTGLICDTGKPSRISKFRLFDDFMSIVGNIKELKNVVSTNYNEAKLLARDYLEAKNGFIKHLETSGYGSWKLMKKPEELQLFRRSVSEETETALT